MIAQSKVRGLRVRKEPSLNGTVIGSLAQGERVKIINNQDRLGASNAWLMIQRENRQVGYVAAWFMTRIKDNHLFGVNLDFQHAKGKPDPALLRSASWVRVEYKAVATRGFDSLQAAHNFYEPILKSYKAQGIKVMLVLTHLTFGEGAGYHWESLYPTSWQTFSEKYATVVEQVARYYAGKGLIDAYQIWNEPDTMPLEARAAVPIPGIAYGGELFSRAFKAIRFVDSQVDIVTAGMVTGPINGSRYMQQVFATLQAGVKPTGIGIHPYGRGAFGESITFAPFGSIGEEINAYAKYGLPVYITEWGILDKPLADVDYAARYLSRTKEYVETLFGDKVRSLIWYAWADSMDNGYGIAYASGAVKTAMYRAAGLDR